ncbi:ankyrin repeat-containing domain protein, partial [Tricladium varicosporioides]
GRSPLSLAVGSGNLEITKLLIAREDVNVNITDRTGSSPLLWAIGSNCGEVIKVLAQFYPQGVDYPEESGRTPLSCAMWGSPSNIETVRILIQTGLVDVNRRALNGRTPLSYAAAVGRPDLVRTLVE